MRIKKLLLYTFLVLGLLVAAVFAVGKYYNNQVKDFVVAKLNERLTAQVKVGEVELTFFDNFPQAAIRFNQVSIADKFSQHQKDTLLYADKLYLSFNIWDIWDKNYKITQLSLAGGMMHLSVNERGETNFDIWKADTTATQTSDFQLKLDEVSIENVFFRFSQPANNQALRCFIKTSKFSGKLTETNFNLETVINARMYGYHINGVEYIKDKNISLETDLAVNTETEKLGFSKVKLAVNQVDLRLNGSLCYGENASIDLSIDGQQVKILDLIASLPEFSKTQISRYNADGFLDIKSRLWGKLGYGNLPKLAAQFTVSKASLEEKNSKVVLRDLQLSGSYHSGFTGSDDSLQLLTLSGKFNSGVFLLSGTLVNFSEPVVNSKVHGNIDLFQLSQFIGTNPTDTIAGTLMLDASIKGTLSSRDTSSQQIWGKLNTEGQIVLKNGHFKLRGANNALENVQGEIKLVENRAVVKQLLFTTKTSDFLLSGQIHNLIPYLFKTDETIAIEANLSSRNIDLADFIEEKSTEGNSTDFRLAFPKNMQGYLNAKIEHLKYHKFAATGVSGKLTLSGEGLLAESIDLKAFNGQVKGAIALKRSGNAYKFENQTTLTKVALDQVFYQLDNFGQTIITNKELKGKADAEVKVSASLNAQLNFDAASIQSTAHLKITNGELNNLEVLQDLTTYLKSNKAIAAVVNTQKLGERLKNVSFATLENTITIKDKQIIIPDMAIRSSALDININGKHSFDNAIDYGLNFRMAEVFQKDAVTDDGYIVDDNTGMRMFISVSGTTENPVFKYDKQSASVARKEKFQQEKTTLKGILKQEMGLFKSDSTLRKVAFPGKAPVRFELEAAGSANQPAGTPATKSAGIKPTKKAPKTEVDTKDYNLDGDI